MKILVATLLLVIVGELGFLIYTSSLKKSRIPPPPETNPEIFFKANKAKDPMYKSEDIKNMYNVLAGLEKKNNQKAFVTIETTGFAGEIRRNEQTNQMVTDIINADGEKVIEVPLTNVKNLLVLRVSSGNVAHDAVYTDIKKGQKISEKVVWDLKDIQNPKIYIVYYSD